MDEVIYLDDLLLAGKNDLLYCIHGGDPMVDENANQLIINVYQLNRKSITQNRNRQDDSGQGFMLGPGLGELLTRMVLKKTTEEDSAILPLLSPYRKFAGQEKLK
ncbi:MAG: hypothetical protein SCM96_13810 [Acidobacteriota bacterium]|nr:hypothetical protein [Acidobacteriota bacterium]